MKRVMTGLVLGLGCLMASPGLSWAADPGLQAEIEILKDRLAKLEERLAGNEGNLVPPTAGEGAATITLPSGLRGVQLSGFVDTAYNYNFNEANSFGNTLRVFDTESSGFTPHNAQLVLEKPVEESSPVGFKTALMFGEDAEVVGGVTTGLGGVGNELEIQQAYVEYLAPIGSGLNVKAGKFSTLAGAEVIESIDNWNYSRSFMFGFAIPFTHTGLRLSYPLTESLSLTGGFSQGYDLVDEGNKAKTIETNLSWAPAENFSLGTTYYFGAEQAGDSHDQRHLLDIVASYQPLEKLTLMLNADIAREEDVVSETGGGSATWNGIAAYAKYDLSDRWSLAGRWEIFNDNDGVRTGVNMAATSPTGSPIADLQLMEWTLTNEYKLHEHLIARLEYRLDKADSAVFLHDQSFEDYQNTVAFELVAPF